MKNAPLVTRAISTGDQWKVHLLDSPRCGNDLTLHLYRYIFLRDGQTHKRGTTLRQEERKKKGLLSLRTPSSSPGIRSSSQQPGDTNDLTVNPAGSPHPSTYLFFLFSDKRSLSFHLFLSVSFSLAFLDFEKLFSFTARADRLTVHSNTAKAIRVS